MLYEYAPGRSAGYFLQRTKHIFEGYKVGRHKAAAYKVYLSPGTLLGVVDIHASESWTENSHGVRMCMRRYYYYWDATDTKGVRISKENRTRKEAVQTLLKNYFNPHTPPTYER
jgi:hypothetical protein